MPQSRFTALATALTILSLALPASAATKITLGYGITSDYLPAFVAKDNGIFEKNGLDVTMVVVTSSSLTPPALVSGSMQIAQANPPNLLLAYEGGIELVSITGVARLMAKNPRTSLVTHPGFTITKAEDLRGKKVAVPGINSAMDLVLRKWLIDGGVKPEQVTIVEAPFAQMGDMLKSGQLDAAFQFEPLLTRILASGSATKSLDLMSMGNPDVLGSVWAATKEWATANRGAVDAYRTSLNEAVDFINKNTEEAHKIEAKYLHYATSEVPDIEMQVTPQDFDYWAGLCRAVGLLHRPVDGAQLIFK